MLISADQLLCHLFGDYVIQSDWMAQEKTKSLWVAYLHACSYALPFLLLRPSMAALAVIVFTHCLIDRYRLARFVCWAKNLLSPAAYRYPWAAGDKLGYRNDGPAWLNVWLLIIADNSLHILINGLALKYL